MGTPGTGPALFENWRAANQNRDIIGAYECPLYSDAWFVGETVTVGPYQFINTLAYPSTNREGGQVAPVLVLRVNLHMEFEKPKMDKTDTSRYHGGWLSDEVAALAALAMGARVEAGPTSREFEPGDVRGKPIAYFGYGIPVLSQKKLGTVLPWVVGRHSSEDLSWIAPAFDTDTRNEAALIRAARLYQDVIWIADAEPDLSWLLLVSALETAADRWRQTTLSATERLRDSKPDLVATIEARCPELLPLVAAGFADSIGATRKFVDFILNFLPGPPEKRPHIAYQVAWSPEFLKPSLRKIYDHRSKALHTGIPFPAPLCDSPMGVGDPEWPAPAERPPCLAASIHGAVWLRQELPISLHIFEYITRKVLQAWWSSLRPVEVPGLTN
jgi:hypothetical protein